MSPPIGDRQTSVITGAGSGIGRAIALAMADQAQALVLTDLSEEGLGETERLVARPGLEILRLPFDVSDEDAVRRAMDTVARRFGRIDNLVSAAGIALTGAVLDMPSETWRKIVDVNLIGTYLAARYAIPLMTQGGAIVAIASDAATRGVAGYSAYCASKHAVIGLVRSLALEYARAGIRTNAVCPSFVETPMAERLLQGVGDAQRRAYQNANPSGRFARPEEVAGAVLHLVDRRQGFVNGMVYAIDGGATAGPYSPA